MKVFVSQFQAAGLALAGFTCWVLADTSLKIAGTARLPAYEVIGLVGASEMVLLLLLAAARRDLGTLWPKRPGQQMLRACLDLANNLCVVVALRHLPLALFYVLVFLAPMVTAVLAVIFLQERLAWRQGLAILVGFAGVVIAANPFGRLEPGEWIGYLACLVCVACFSANMVWSRVMTQTEAPESLIFFSGLVMAGGGLAGMLWYAQPMTATMGSVLASTGLFSVVGSLCFFVALKHTSAANVSQYHYSQLITGTLIAYLIWREKLPLSMFVGGAMILVAGVYMAWHAYVQRPVSGAVELDAL